MQFRIGKLVYAWKIRQDQIFCHCLDLVQKNQEFPFSFSLKYVQLVHHVPPSSPSTLLCLYTIFIIITKICLMILCQETDFWRFYYLFHLHSTCFALNIHDNESKCTGGHFLRGGGGYSALNKTLLFFLLQKK